MVILTLKKAVATITNSIKKLADFLKTEAKKDEKGYVRLVIAKSKNPSEKNGSHYCYIDDWKPTRKQENSKPVEKKSETPSEPDTSDDHF